MIARFIDWIKARREVARWHKYMDSINDINYDEIGIG